MSIARHHADWLSLVEVSGPFVSMPVLMRVFPDGLDRHDPEHARELRQAFAEWEANQESRRPDPAIHTAWIRFVLHRTLDLPKDTIIEGPALPPVLHVRMSAHGETLHPDLAVVNPPGRPDAGTARVLVQVLPASQDLDRPLEGSRWKASPATRMMELLHGADVALGLVTNGERWMLVHAPRGETTGFASWYAPVWLEEPVTLQAFRSLIGCRRLFGVADADTLEALLTESARDQQEVTDQLGFQVRRAVEVLIQTLDRIDADRGRTLLAGIDEKRLYEAALTVMMRLVFLLSAEERKLLLLGDPLFDQHYAVSTLLAQLQETKDKNGEEILGFRHDAWGRLLATFRAVHGGVHHDRLTIPAYGGTLFDPDRYPFLEGRAVGTKWRDTPADPLPIDNRTVLHLLEAIQVLQVKVPGGGPAEPRRLSFRALDIEQIGHVYERLLDHTAVRSTTLVIGFAGAKDKEPELPLADVETVRLQGEDALIDYLAEQTGRSASAVRRALANVMPLDDPKLAAACGHDEGLRERVLPYGSLLRRDSREYPVVIRKGDLYVTEGTDRRKSGTHYTPRSLTEPMVQHTLDPLVYRGMADGLPPSPDTLVSAPELLSLRVCDMACGSGAFLVQATRYLAEKLCEVWSRAEEANPGHLIVTPEGALSQGAPDEQPITRDAEERLTLARRIVAERCLFGVDVNPMAVEMAKLSLWLVTLAKGRAFTFLDHAIRCGDSLLGLTRNDQVLAFNVDVGPGRPMARFSGDLQRALDLAAAKRRELESIEVVDVRQAEAKERLLAEAQRATGTVRLIADAIVGAALAPPARGRQETDRRLDVHASVVLDPKASEAKRSESLEALATRTNDALKVDRPQGSPPRSPFHWLIEFPEVFASDVGGESGFHAIIGNPPFQGGKLISGALGSSYRDYLVHHVAAGIKGHADLCAYFFLRARDLLRPGGGFGLLSTNSIAQGDTREVGLDQMVDHGCSIIRAIPSRKWPGEANLEVAHVWVRRGGWKAEVLLDDHYVPGITPFLVDSSASGGKPFRLCENAGKSFQGSIILGMGFVLTPEQAQALISKNPANREVLFPYLNGEDLNTSPDQSPSRWVINFHDWPLAQASQYSDCMAIVMEKVKPERERLAGGDASARGYAERWWQFGRRSVALYNAVAHLENFLVSTRVTKFLVHSLIPTGPIIDVGVNVVLPFPGVRAVLESTFYGSWVRSYASTLETRVRYTLTDCFETYPFPRGIEAIEALGTDFHRHRTNVMRARWEGLTKTYNRFHDPTEVSSDIARLRDLQVEMDDAVAAAYDWSDIDLGHGFHPTKQGSRFTLSEPARREVLTRLLKLNHERHAAEVAVGLDGSRKRPAKKRSTGHDDPSARLL